MVNNTLEGEPAATYLYRTIEAPTRRRMTISLGSDDSILVWINGQQVFNRKITRTAAADQETITIQLEAGENHLLNLCVAPHWQRKGYGNLMLDHAIRLARLQKCSSMFLEVRPSNPSGIRLYEQKGFCTVGKRPGYYRAADGREDAIVMRLDL